MKRLVRKEWGAGAGVEYSETKSKREAGAWGSSGECGRSRSLWCNKGRNKGTCGQAPRWPSSVLRLPRSHLLRSTQLAALQQVKAPASMDLGRIFPRGWLEGSCEAYDSIVACSGSGGMHHVLTRAKAQMPALERQFPSSRSVPLSQKQRWEGTKAAGEQIHMWVFPWVLPQHFKHWW